MNAPHPLHVLHPVERQQGRELPHESARLHVTGEAVYIDDIPEVRGTLYAALVLSPVAHGELLGEGIDRETILREHGVVAVFTAADIPGENNCGPIIHDDPFLADGKVEFLGQPVAVVVARQTRRGDRRRAPSCERPHHLRPAGAVLSGRANRLRRAARGWSDDDIRLDPASRRQPA